MSNSIARALLAVVFISASANSFSAAVTFNSPNNNIAATRDAWLAAVGISSPEYFEDFETGFSDGQNVSGIAGLFPGGLVIRDTSSSGSATIEGTPGGIGGSNPVGNFALEQNERPFLELDFSANPVDYVGFRDIDHTGTNVVITFVGGATQSATFEGTSVSGDSAEFFAVFRNDMPRITLLQLDSSGDRSWGIDNLEYGPAPVPLPAAVWLLGGAVGCLWSQRRRLC